MEATSHVPVLVAEVVAALKAAEGGRFLDCTLGGGGHAAAILAANPRNSVVAFDRDSSALERAARRFAGDDRIQCAHGAFSDLEASASGKFDGMLADLGLSTDQLKTDRGFSFSDEGPLDMRMDRSAAISAATIVNDTEEQELYVLLRRGGVGPEARRVARAIAAARPITETKVLADVVKRAIVQGPKKKKVHPATVVFQAIRIAVNRELEELEALLDASRKLVKSGGRLAVITFHSLEDKVVTHTMREWEHANEAPASWRGAMRGAAEAERIGRLLTKKPIVPQPEEVERNASARSAGLRVFEFRE